MHDGGPHDRALGDVHDVEFVVKELQHSAQKERKSMRDSMIR
jgi:hypothetical protein